MRTLDRHINNALGLELTSNLKETDGLVIGKANVRYTLWVYHYSESGILSVSYVRNLCNDVNKVSYQFPDVYICESLKGSEWHFESHSSSKSSTAPVKRTLDDFDCLPFGKYAGISFDKINDCSYWCWLANQENSVYEDVDFKPLYVKRAIELGAIEINHKYYDPNWVETRDWYQVYKEIKPLVDENKPFEFVATANRCDFWFGLPIYFKPEDTYSFTTYYGGGHFLVVTDKKGNRKNKRTKGKTITISKYQVLKDGMGCDYVLVDEFSMR